MATPTIHERKNIQLSDVHKVYFKVTENECVPGQSYVVNNVGKFYMYMGDDLRSCPSKQIIVTELGGGDLSFLGIHCKKEIEIITRGY